LAQSARTLSALRDKRLASIVIEILDTVSLAKPNQSCEPDLISQNAYMIVIADAGAGIVGRHHQRLGPSAAGSTDLSQCRRAVFGDLIECSHTARGEHAHH